MDQSIELQVSMYNTIFVGGAILWTVLSSIVIYIQYSATSSVSTEETLKPKSTSMSKAPDKAEANSLEMKIRLGAKPPAKKGIPPCLPGRCPLFGHTFANLFDPAKPHLGLTELAKKHGDVFSMQILQQNIVVVNELTLIKEALNNNAFSGRPFIFRIHYGFHGAKDIIFGTYSKKWAYMKKISAQGLRMFGYGSSLVDTIVQKETVALKEAIIELSDDGLKSFDPRICLLTSVVNGLAAAILGRSFDHDDPVMAEYKLTTRLFSESCSIVNGMELDLFPWLRFLPNQNFKKLTYARNLLDNWIDRELQAAKDRYDGSDPKCILDLLFETRDNPRQENGENFEITDADIRSIFVDLLVSGTFTTAIALSTFVYLLMEFPGLQKDLQKEASCHSGTRVPSSEERKKMPLIEATILEILRYISHVPLNLPHFTLENTTLGEYRIPKNTQVLLNLWATHHDPEIWKDPWKFNPYRFLDKKGNLLPTDHKNRRSLIPFSSGRRACLGESLARERLFIFATTIVQNFQVLPPEGCDCVKPCDPRDFDLGLILEPKPFEIKIVKRQ